LALTGYQLALLGVAGVFIAFALLVALVVPRARPDFPGKRLGVFVAICVALFAAQMGAVLALAELGEEHGEAEAAETTTSETPTTETTDTETETETESTETETESTETETTGAAGDPVAGKEVFTSVAQPSCTSCHTLADAGATGTVGPNLDAAQPPYDLVVDRVTNGQGVMPSFSGSLSEEQIQDVAAYVSSAAG
jgi:mono/diheme cytochrome c family protein